MVREGVVNHSAAIVAEQPTVAIPSDHIETTGALVGRRITRFLTTTPDEAHNRRRLLFALIAFFVICILVTLGSFILIHPKTLRPQTLLST
jgi:hypothetical protein